MKNGNNYHIEGSYDLKTYPVWFGWQETEEEARIFAIAMLNHHTSVEAGMIGIRVIRERDKKEVFLQSVKEGKQ